MISKTSALDDYPKGAVFIDPPYSGAINMQIDNALLAYCQAAKRECAFIRIYEWSEATISLGLSQRRFSQSLDANGFPWVMRSTGGQAVLHDKEVTYCVCASSPHTAFGDSLYHSYFSIAEILLESLKSLGVKAEAVKERTNSKEAKMNPVCYAAASIYEIQYDGKKLIGSAQKRKQAAFLQHGSIPFERVQHRLSAVFGREEDSAANLEKEISLREILADLPDKNDYKNQLANEFIKKLNQAPTKSALPLLHDSLSYIKASA